MLAQISFTLALLTLVQTANILLVVPAPASSHQAVYQPIWKELSLRGHQVHVITPNPLNDPTLTNLTEINISSAYEFLQKVIPQNDQQYILKKPDFLTTFLKDSFVTKFMSMFMEYIFQHENVQTFLSEDHHFDVCVIEWLYPTMAALGEKFKCPIVGITSLGAPIVALDTVGNPSHPAYAPDHNLPLSRDMNFRERLMSALYAVYVRIYYHLVILPREDALAKKYLGQDLPYLGDIERNISLLLLNRNPVLHRIVPVVPAIIELGIVRRNTPRQEEIDPDLKSFLDNSKHGVIYFSLGSSMGSHLLPETTRNIFRDCFAQLPYDVVWKVRDEDLSEKPANVLTRDWIPQTQLLGHENVKLFITQGGLQSTEEAIANHVPIIGIPCAHDQSTNVATCVKYGMGIKIDMEEITLEKLNSSIHQIINDGRYRENVIKLYQLLHDQPQDGLERAIWWIEYVIRHKGAKHLRSHSLDISWIQYLMLDIIAFLVATLLFILLLSYLSIRLAFKALKFLFKRTTVSDDQIETKKSK